MLIQVTRFMAWVVGDVENVPPGDEARGCGQSRWGFLKKGGPQGPQGV